MLPIPHDIDLDSLRERSVTEVCYSSTTITIHFEDTAYITIEGYFAFRYKKQRHEYYKLAPITDDYNLLKLLGAEVSEVFLNNNRDGMTIEFNEGSRLELMGHQIDDSYTIHIKDKEAVV